MKARSLLPVAAMLLLANVSLAGTRKPASHPKPVVMEYDIASAQWIPARTIAVASPPVTQGRLRTPARHDWRWYAMQPVRAIVIVAKIPILLAAFPAMEASIALANCREDHVPYVDFGPAFENFDPGPAIEADLERSAFARRARDPQAPSPLKTEVQSVRR